MVKLGDVCTINPRLPKDTDESQNVSFLTMSAVSEKGKIIEQETRTLSETKKGFTYFEKGDILLAKITPCFENGKATHTTELNTQIGYGSTEFHVLRALDQVADGKYIFYLVWNDIFRFHGQHSMRGAAGQKRISADFLKQFKIPLPPLPEQQKIAAILDTADQLRQKDQQLIEHYTRLGQSLFLKMFGEIFKNPKGFSTCKLEKLVDSKKDIVDGPFGSSINTKIDYCEDGEIPVIRTKNVSIKNTFVVHDLKFMRRKKYETVIRSQTLPGDIVLTKVGTIGNICIMPDLYDEYVLSTTGSCRIRINEEKTNKLYFLHYLNFYKPRMLDIASAGVQAFLNMKHIKGFDILCPPLKLQNQFAQHIEAIEQQKQSVQASLEKSEALFNSLLQRAFKGELTG